MLSPGMPGQFQVFALAPAPAGFFIIAGRRISMSSAAEGRFNIHASACAGKPS